MENNWQPLIGQNVISLVGTDGDLLHKGEIKTVLDVSKCKCGRHMIRVNVTNPYDSLYCEFCKITIGKSGEDIWWDTCIFAPINPYSNSVSQELAEKAMEVNIETDVPVKREVVNN